MGGERERGGGEDYGGREGGGLWRGFMVGRVYGGS